MAFQWMRRLLLAVAPAALLALAGCGSGTIESQFQPTRVVVFGDALSDTGNTSTGKVFSVNDGVSRIWPEIVAANFGLGLAKSSAPGGTNYATGNARIVLTPDAAGGSAPTIKAQIDTFLASNTFGPNDLVMIQGGTADVIVQMQAFRAGTITSDELTANVKQAAHDLAAQAMRLTAAGANHVVVMSMYDLSKTPWATTINQAALLSQVSIAFNNTVLVDLVNQGNKMLYVDIALLVNLMANNPPLYNLTDSTTVVCNSVDAGPGIGIGTGQVNSSLCVAGSTIIAGISSYLAYMWADPIYPTPTIHSQIGGYVYTTIHSRW